MLDTILGFKQKMGTVYIRDRRYPVTWVKVDPCIVTQIKHEEKDGYMAVQLATGSKRIKNISKPLQGHLRVTENQKSPLRQGSEGQAKIKNQKLAPRYIKEIRIKEDSGLKVGDEVKVTDVLKTGDVVTVIGISKGKGFAGVVKRWRFAGGPKTHGQSDRERAPGSIGNRTSPGRVFKGKKMAGRMGSDRVTVKNLNIIDIDKKNNLIAITGAVPGVTKGLIFIRKTGEGSVFVQNFDETKEVKIEKTEQVEKVELVEQEENKKKTEKVESFDKAQDAQAVEVKKVEQVEKAEKIENKENEENKKEGKEENAKEELKNSKTEKLKDESVGEDK